MSRSWITSGVIQPGHSFRRGNTSLSRMSTSAPPWRSLRAAEEPAGPPPMISTSLWITRGFYALGLVQMIAGERDIVVVGRREQHLEQLQRAGRECRDRTGQVQPPHAHEFLVEHAAHA